MDPDVPEVTALLTISGVTVVTIIVMEVVKRAAELSAGALDRFGALLAIATATVLALLALFVVNGTAVAPESVLQAVLVGIFGGAAASGIYGMTSHPTQ